MNLINAFIAGIIFMMLMQPYSFAQNGCVKNNLGQVSCAPAGGSAVNSLSGVLCAPGRCAVNDLGYLKCSNELSGAVIKDDLGRIICVGECISPTKDYCVEITKGEKK